MNEAEKKAKIDTYKQVTMDALCNLVLDLEEQIQILEERLDVYCVPLDEAVLVKIIERYAEYVYVAGADHKTYLRFNEWHRRAMAGVSMEDQP